MLDPSQQHVPIPIPGRPPGCPPALRHHTQPCRQPRPSGRPANDLSCLAQVVSITLMISLLTWVFVTSAVVALAPWVPVLHSVPRPHMHMLASLAGTLMIARSPATAVSTPRACCRQMSLHTLHTVPVPTGPSCCSSLGACACALGPFPCAHAGQPGRRSHDSLPARHCTVTSHALASFLALPRSSAWERGVVVRRSSPQCLAVPIGCSELVLAPHAQAMRWLICHRVLHVSQAEGCLALCGQHNLLKGR